jgi:hypothetical protein
VIHVYLDTSQSPILIFEETFNPKSTSQGAMLNFDQFRRSAGENKMKALDLLSPTRMKNRLGARIYTIPLNLFPTKLDLKIARPLCLTILIITRKTFLSEDSEFLFKK